MQISVGLLVGWSVGWSVRHTLLVLPINPVLSLLSRWNLVWWSVVLRGLWVAPRSPAPSREVWLAAQLRKKKNRAPVAPHSGAPHREASSCAKRDSRHSREKKTKKNGRLSPTVTQSVTRGTAAKKKNARESSRRDFQIYLSKCPC